MATKDGFVNFEEVSKWRIKEEIKKRKVELTQGTSSLIKKGGVTSENFSRNHPADASFEPDYAAGHLDRLKEEIVLFEQALESVDAGTYGVCMECGEPIPLKRLDAVPLTKDCTPCLSEKEKKKRRGKRKSDDPTKQQYALVVI